MALSDSYYSSYRPSSNQSSQNSQYPNTQLPSDRSFQRTKSSLDEVRGGSAYNITPPAASPRFPLRSQRAWPPPASVEDESVSLAREANDGLRSNDVANLGDVPNRGTIDQEPILIDVENHDRRYVLVSRTEQTSIGRPDTTRHEKGARSAKARRNPPELLDTTLAQGEGQDGRRPRPYSFVRTPENPSFSASPSSHTSRSGSVSDSVRQSKNTQKNRHANDGYASTPSGWTDESDVDLKSALRARTGHGKTAGSAAVLQDSLRRAPLTSDSSQSNRSAPSSPRPLSPISDHDRSSSGIKRSHHPGDPVKLPEKGIKPAATYPISPASASSRSPRRHGAIDPIKPAYLYPSPPITPQLHRTSTAPEFRSGNGRRSQNSSRESSPERSMPFFARSGTSKGGPPSPRQGIVEPSRYASNTQPARPTPLSASMRQESVDKLRTSTPVTGSKKGTSQLPYPIEEPVVSMPDAPEFAAPIPSINDRTAGASYKSSFLENERKSPRASVAYPQLPDQDTSPKFSTYSQQSPGDKREVTTAKPPSAIHLPPCPTGATPELSKTWYTLIGSDKTRICQSCYDGIVRPSQYRHYITPMTERSSAKRECHFGMPWTRLAWLLTQQRQRRDLTLVYGVIAIELSEPPCSGTAINPRESYVPRSTTTSSTPVFSICQADRKRVELLFPSMSGSFARQSLAITPCSLSRQSQSFAKYLDTLVSIDASASKDDRPPDLRPLHTLAGLNPRQKLPYQMPTATPPPNLTPKTPDRSQQGQHEVQQQQHQQRHRQQPAPAKEQQQNLYHHYCHHDEPLKDALWHYIPTFPECTICQDCYARLIVPYLSRSNNTRNNSTTKPNQIPKSSSLARSFNTTPQPLPPTTIYERGMLPSTSSCQLYSSRMRKIWEKAVRKSAESPSNNNYDEGLMYLMRKIRERRKVEGECRLKERELNYLLANGRGFVGGKEVFARSGRDREFVRAELEAIEMEWVAWE